MPACIVRLHLFSSAFIHRLFAMFVGCRPARISWLFLWWNWLGSFWLTRLNFEKKIKVKDTDFFLVSAWVIYLFNKVLGSIRVSRSIAGRYYLVNCLGFEKLNFKQQIIHVAFRIWYCVHYRGPYRSLCGKWKPGVLEHVARTQHRLIIIQTTYNKVLIASTNCSKETAFESFMCQAGTPLQCWVC